VAKHLIDTDLYIDLIQSGTTLPFIRELYDKEAPGIYFSSIVAQELLAGARSPASRKRVSALFQPFEKVGRIVTPITTIGKMPEPFWRRYYTPDRTLKVNYRRC